MDNTATEVVPTEPVTIDRVNNISQKELALHKSGVTRRKIGDVVAEGLCAVKVRTEVVDGEVHKVEEPDTAMRLKAAELGLNAFGDLDKNKVVEQSARVSVTIDAKDVGMFNRLADTLEEMNRKLFELPMEMRGDVINVEGKAV